MKKTFPACLLVTLVLSFALGSNNAHAAVCEFFLKPAPDQRGAAKVFVGERFFAIKFWWVNPHSLYTIWTDHRNRATGELSPDYPLEQHALPRGVAPTFASTAGVTSGMGLDPNGVITNEWGFGKLVVPLDYQLLRPGASPVVGEALAMQGLNRVGGGWLRVYRNPRVEKEASLQRVDRRTGLPLLWRSTAQGITVVRHPDKTSHGHTPGVGGVDHFPAFSGDFPHWCRVSKETDVAQ